MAKSTIGKSASDKAFDNVLGQIKRIKAAEKRGESLENFSHYRTTPVTQKPASAKSASLTAAIVARPMRTKRKRNTIDPKAAELELLSIETGVPLELLKRNPNLRLKK